jgi:hypothetical protein
LRKIKSKNNIIIVSCTTKTAQLSKQTHLKTKKRRLDTGFAEIEMKSGMGERVDSSGVADLLAQFNAQKHG